MPCAGWVRWLTRHLGIGIVGLVLLVPALALAPFGITQKVHETHFREHAVAASGTVVDRDGVGGRSGYVVTVAYRAGDEPLRLTAHVSEGDDRGDHVGIYYDPTDPAHAELADTRTGGALDLWHLFLLFLGGGLGFLVLDGVVTGFVVWSQRRRRTTGTT